MSDIIEEMGGYMGDGSEFMEFEKPNPPPASKPDDELAEIFSLEFIAAPEMIIESEGLLFRWNPDWLDHTKAQLLAWRDRQVAEALKNLISNYSEIHTVRKTIIWGTDTVSKGSSLAMVPVLYINYTIDELKPEPLKKEDV